MRAETKKELNAFFKAKLATAIAIGIQVVVLWRGRLYGSKDNLERS